MNDALWPSIPDSLRFTKIILPETFRELVAKKEYSNEDVGRLVRCIALDTDFFMTQRLEPEVTYYRRIAQRNLVLRDARREQRRKKKEAAGPDTGPKKPIGRPRKVVPVEADKPAEPLERTIGGPVVLSKPVDDKLVVQDVESVSRGAGERVTVDTREDAAWIPAKFAVFWQRYPRKDGRKEAMKEFTRLVKSQGDVDRFMEVLLGALNTEQSAVLPLADEWLKRWK